MKAPATAGQFAPISRLTDLRKVIDTTLASHGTLAKGATTTVSGRKVIAVKDLAEGRVLYVATNGKPFPAEIARGGASGGHVVFDQWNQPVTISSPPNAINLNQLQAGH